MHIGEMERQGVVYYSFTGHYAQLDGFSHLPGVNSITHSTW